MSINGLANVVQEVTGSNSPVLHVSYEEAYGKGFEDMYRRVPDLSRIRTAIGYRPSKTLREIVQAVTSSLVHPEKREIEASTISASFAQAD